MNNESCFFNSPKGWLQISASTAGITKISPSENRPGKSATSRNPIIVQCCNELAEYFNHSRTSFTVPLDVKGSDFQMKVWKSLAEIPYGVTTTYGAIARKCGRPKAFQAVGQIVGNNPIPIILPCHRVMGANGKLTGFGWGIPWKIWLLQHENIEMGLF